MNPVIWIHADSLRADNPAFQHHPAAPALFVWDDALLDEMQISFKRIVFIYECLLDLPVVIRRGDVTQQLLAFAHEHQADSIATVASVSPRFKRIAQQLERTLPLHIYHETPLIDHEGRFDLRRFSRFWEAAQPYAMQPTKRDE